MSNSEVPSPPSLPLLDPVLEVRLHLDPDILASLEESGRAAAIRSSIEAALEELCAGFGVPGRVNFRIAPAEARSQDQDRFFRLEMGSRIARYGTAPLRNLRHLLDPDVEPTTEDRPITAWLSAVPGELAQRYLQFVALHVASANASLLLGPAQFECYRLILLRDEGVSPDELTGAGEILRDVLDLGISLRDRARVAKAFLRPSGGLLGIRESLIDSLVMNTIQICMPEHYLEELTTGGYDWAEDFKLLTESILVPLGLQRPALTFTLDETLSPRSFRFKVNDRFTAPLAGLSPLECLVSDSPSRLRLRGLHARAVNHPATGVPYALSELAHRSEFEMEGKTVWDARAYLTLCLSEVMTRNAYCLISQERSKAFLDSLDVQYPSIAGYVRDLVPIETMTVLLRELIEEGVPVRNVRKVFECIAGAATDPDPLVRVRAGMARELTRQIGRLYGIPVVYLLDRPIVEILASGQVLSVELEESVLEAIHREMRQLPVGASSPCLLAPANLRRRLRALTREEFPNTPVVTYAELAPDFSVQPVARVS